MPINMIDADLAKAANCKHPHMRNDGYCPACGSTIVGYTPAPPVPTQPHDAAADAFCNGVSDDAPQDMQRDCGCGLCRLIWNTWNLKRAYLASRQREALLDSTVADAQRMIAQAERDSDALRKALLRGRAYIAAVSSATSATDTRSKVLAVIDAALARSAKP